MIIDWENEGFPQARIKFRQIGNHLTDFRSMHQKAGQSLLDWSKRNLISEGTLLKDFSRGWPPLSQATLASKRKRGLSIKPLQETGRLREGFELEVNEQQAVINNPVPYASLHQLGVGVPRRPIFPGPVQTEEIIFPIIQRHVAEILG